MAGPRPSASGPTQSLCADEFSKWIIDAVGWVTCPSLVHFEAEMGVLRGTAWAGEQLLSQCPCPSWLVKLEVLAVTPSSLRPSRSPGSEGSFLSVSNLILVARFSAPWTQQHRLDSPFLFHVVSWEDSYWSTLLLKAFSRCSLICHIHSWLQGRRAWDWSLSLTWFPILGENTLPLPPGVPFPDTPVTSSCPPGPPLTLTSHPPRRPPCSRPASLPSPLNNPSESWVSH